MTAKLTKPLPKSHTYAKALRDGQIAIITEGDWEGDIIQRSRQDLVTIGRRNDIVHGYYDNADRHAGFRCRILQDGETITITNNQ